MDGPIARMRQPVPSRRGRLTGTLTSSMDAAYPPAITTFPKGQGTDMSFSAAVPLTV